MELKHLGSGKTKYPNKLSRDLLEAIPLKASQKKSWVSLLCPEFTSLCPKTNQPDFAKITINYIPDKSLVESKSLKLYLFSYRNHGGFHEDCIKTIGQDLNKLLRPNYLEVLGEFTPRGGISIYPFEQFSKKTYDKLLKERQQRFSPRLYSGF